MNKLIVAIMMMMLLFAADTMHHTAIADPHGPNLPDNKPPPPPPPPPPCNGGGGDCPKVCSMEPGSENSVSYLTGFESMIRTDIEVKAAYPIKMTRQYVSASQYDSPLGYGWAFQYNLRLFEYPDNSVIIRTGCGVNYKYVYTAGSYQTTEGGYSATLVKQADGSFDLTYLDGSRDHFDTQGNITETYDVAGNFLRFTYDADGKLPLIGSSPYAVDPSLPATIAYNYRLEKIESFMAGGATSGKYVTLNYNETTGRLMDIISDDGRQVSYQHDLSTGISRGNLEQVNGLENVVSTYKYEDYKAGTSTHQDYHNITEIKDHANSVPVVLTYDASDRVIKEVIGNREYTFNWNFYGLSTPVTEKNTDDQGMNQTTAVRSYDFNVTGYVNSMTDALGNKTDYQLDAYGNRIKEQFYEYQSGTLILVKTIDRQYSTDGLKQHEEITLDNGETITTNWTYDGTREATMAVSSSASPGTVFKIETLYNHDTSGKPTTVQAERRYKDNGTYLETRYTYNANGDVVTTTLPDGHVIENEYGPEYSGRYVTRTFHRDSGGAPMAELEETYQYDNKGNRTHVTDALNHTTITSYDDKNRRATVTNHLGHLTTFEYDANNNLVYIKRDRSAVADQLDITKLTYDGLNRLTRIDRSNASAVYELRASMRYDSAGNVIARGDAYGVETILQYDLENRLTHITDADGNYIQYTLNVLGQRTKTEYYKTGNILVRESSAVFDDLNRQEQIIGAATQTTTFSYDAVGNRITAIDALARPTTEYTYDTLSRLTNIKDANTKNTQYQYDDRDRLRYVTDPRGLITQYQYNALGQLTTLISPDTNTTEYTYDLAGNRKTQTDARNITVTYEYDALNRITKKIYPNTALNVTYTYDTAANGIGKLASMQDAEGIEGYAYDTHGNLVSRNRYSNARFYLTTYGYDNNDRLIKVTYPSLRTVDYTRNALGQVTSISTTPSGGVAQTIASSISYLPFGALEDINWGNGLTLDQSYDSDYRLTDQVLGTIYDRDYVYDAVNNIKDIIDNTPAAKTQSFNYDVLDRLDDATSSGTYGALDYAYDDVGNRISLTLDGGTPTNYNYSATANNRLDDIAGAVITYDAVGNTKTKNGLTFTYDDTNRMAQANTTTYGFNGKGERVRKTNGASITLYHYDETGNLLLETNGAGSTLVEYIWLGSQRIAMVQGGSVYFNHTDHLGTPQLLTDSTGAVAWQAEYDPFGEATVTTATIENNLRFPGQYYDQETQLHYNYFRDYDPSIGRYIESDPIGLLGGVNTFSYTINNPVTNIDDYGLNYAVILDRIITGLGLACDGLAYITDAQGLYDRGIATIDQVFKDKMGDIKRNTEFKQERCEKKLRDCIKKSGNCPVSFEHPCWKKRDACVKKVGEDAWESMLKANSDHLEAKTRLDSMVTNHACVTTR